jgi:hypothetical protein
MKRKRGRYKPPIRYVKWKGKRRTWRGLVRMSGIKGASRIWNSKKKGLKGMTKRYSRIFGRYVWVKSRGKR